MDLEDSLLGATAEEDRMKNMSTTREDVQKTIRRLQAMADQQAECISRLMEQVTERIVPKPEITKPKNIPMITTFALPGVTQPFRIIVRTNRNVQSFKLEEN